MVKLLKAEFDIFALRKTQGGQRVDYKGTLRTRFNDISNKNIKSNERQYLSGETDDRTWRRVDDRLEAVGELKSDSGKTQSR